MKKTSQKYIKKLYGFTLVEMMVVIAIIAILASMGVLGYKGYLKEVRDTQRIADIATLNSIVLDFRRSTGKYPGMEEYNSVVMAANGGKLIVDPLDPNVACFTAQAITTPDYCSYLYYTCDAGEGYVLSAKFETSYNAQKYTQMSNDTAWYYNSGHCTTLDLPPAQSIVVSEDCRTKADCVPESVCVGPPPKHCRAKNQQTIGSECDENNDCQSDNCNVNTHKCKA